MYEETRCKEQPDALSLVFHHGWDVCSSPEGLGRRSVAVLNNERGLKEGFQLGFAPPILVSGNIGN